MSATEHATSASLRQVAFVAVADAVRLVAAHSFLGRLQQALSEEFDGLSLRRSLLLGVAAALPVGSLNRMRTRLIRLAGISVGTGSVVGGPLTVTGSPRDVHIGRDCWINTGCLLDASSTVTIGNGVSIAHDVLILTNTHAIGPAERRAGPLESRPVSIGDGCWLGARSIVLPGVTVGSGAIVAAGAVVNRDVAPNTLVAGLPAVVVRTLPADCGR